MKRIWGVRREPLGLLLQVLGGGMRPPFTDVCFQAHDSGGTLRHTSKPSSSMSPGLPPNHRRGDSVMYNARAF